MTKETTLKVPDKLRIMDTKHKISKCGFWLDDILRTSSSSIKSVLGS
jgi:hypothetical protein